MKLKSILFAASAMLVFGTVFGQLHVSTGGTKYVLVEEATGPGCGYCPDGAQDIEEKIEPVYPRAIIASWHGSSYDATSMVVTGDPYCSGTGFITGFPEGTVDRAVFSGNVGLSRPWHNQVYTRYVLNPNFDVTMTCTYVPTTRVINITVTGTALAALTGNWNINALITEDSISSAASGYQQHSYLYTSTTACDGMTCWFYNQCSAGCPGYACSSCAILPPAIYSHMNVVRSILCTGGSVWGESAFTNPALGATVTKTYTYTIPATSNPHFVKVIGLVEKYGSTATDRAIENCIQSHVSLMPASTVGVEMTNAMTEISLYPNPANTSITVKGVLNEPSITQISIHNVIGQILIEKSFPKAGSMFAENIDLSKLSSGLYFMEINNNGEKVSKQFTISR